MIKWKSLFKILVRYSLTMVLFWMMVRLFYLEESRLALIVQILASIVIILDRFSIINLMDQLFDE